MDQKVKTSLGIAVLIIIAFTAGLFIWHYEVNQSINETQIENPELKNKLANPISCTEEAKKCSDGSYVSRTGPNCEFAPCPKDTSNTFTHKSPVIENVMCKDDTEQCSDGSLVRRAGLDCEFMPCPGEKSPSIVGGACEYQSVPGNCHILSIAPDRNTKFIYSANGQLSPNDIPLEKNLNGEHSDAINMLNPDNVPFNIGDSIYCEAKLITKGTCTPVLFRFAVPSRQPSANN